MPLLATNDRTWHAMRHVASCLPAAMAGTRMRCTDGTAEPGRPKFCGSAGDQYSGRGCVGAAWSVPQPSVAEQKGPSGAVGFGPPHASEQEPKTQQQPRNSPLSW